MYYQKISAIFLTLLFLGACTSSGTRIEPAQLNTIVRGQTTEQEVLQRFGQPSGVTVTPTRRILVYDYVTDNRVGQNVVASTASVLGGVTGGAWGSLAGSIIGGNAVPNQSRRQRLSIDIDTASGTVSNYQFQRSQTGP